MRLFRRSWKLVTLLCWALLCCGCQTTGTTATAPGTAAKTGQPAEPKRKARPRKGRATQDPIRRVACLYDEKPWLNLDTAGDRDPEGIRFRVFLIPQSGGKGELREGSLRVEMYLIERTGSSPLTRTLISDWNLTTAEVPQVRSRMLGMGYHLRLRWAQKETAGHEVELITHFEDAHGRKVRSGTKRFRVPKYAS